MFHFNKKHFKIAISIFIIEILIAIIMHDRFIRPFFGDFLAVIFVYYCLKSFFKISISTNAIFSLGFAYFLEGLQYFNFLEYSGLAKYHIIAILLGNSFAWADILSYSLGVIFVIFLEYRVFIINYFKIISL
jgi:hypothetical protein